MSVNAAFLVIIWLKICIPLIFSDDSDSGLGSGGSHTRYTVGYFSHQVNCRLFYSTFHQVILSVSYPDSVSLVPDPAL